MAPRTSKAIRAAYDKRTYRRYQFEVRYDSELYKNLEDYSDEPVGTLVKRLLEKYFKEKNKNA